MKVLVVDDSAENRYLTEAMLTSRGHTVVSAVNGVEALEAARKGGIGLIVSDVLMPKMDGYRLCRECKRDDSLKDTPFVFLTSTYTDEKDESFAVSLGADAFIRRPIEPDAFLRIIDAVIAAHPAFTGLDAEAETRYWAGYADRLVNRLEKKISDLEIEIGARRRAEEALRESEERYRSLVAALFEGVILFDRDGEIRAYNASAGRMFGLNGDHRPGRSPFDPDSAPIREDGTPFTEETCPLGVTLATGEPCQNVIIGFGDEDRGMRWMSVNSQPLRRPGTDKPYAAVVSFADITEQRALERELERQARTDPLTNLANRRRFMELADQEMAMSRRYRHPLSLLMLDIDFFKAVNDNYGHQAGDIALRELARTCRRELRDVDVFGRLGGEEFGILLPETTPERATQVADRLRRAVAAGELPLGNGTGVRMTVSIGITTQCDADTSIDALLHRADAALYEAKRAGRDQVCIAPAPAPADSAHGAGA